ncbi:cytochrome P450 2B4-like isoform X2 [Trichomycterus rosablanca]|uniref:cytochrome P450 2B4-like isoform X2 n=1 Tax=Trichomycterus rosablanca TaxID=2290929 RepID=UPI002F358D39
MQSVLRYLDLTSVALALLVGLVSLVVLEIFRLRSLKRRLPPGPTPLPFVGTTLYFFKNPVRLIKSMVQYGDLCTVYIGRRPTIFLNSLDVMKEALVHNGIVFAGRPSMPIMEWISGGNGIVMVTYNHAWKQQRRFALHTLRNFGLGKKSVEERVSEEAQCLIKEILKQEGKAFDPIHLTMNAVSNIICSIVFGDRFEYDNQRFAKLLKILNEHIVLFSSWVTLIVVLFPFMIRLPGPHQKIYQNVKAFKDFIREAMVEHRKMLDPENLRDFIDAYLVEMDKNSLNEDSTFHEENLVMSTSDLFLAGTETTSTTLRWGFIFMMTHPEVQERCHEEIIRVLGYDRTPTMDDRAKLPYTHATVHEILRFGNILPTSVTHETMQTTQLRGYTIPKETLVMANLAAILMDKDHWKHPDTFNPENFLDENGQFCKDEFFLPFSIGPRVCLGESLARTELFIFFTSLLQRLQFSWPPNTPPVDLDGILGMVKIPHPFQMICRSRDVHHVQM